MRFLDHTIIWVKGEAFEMSVLALAGAVLLLIAGLIWKLASTPVGQALPIPLAVVAMIFIVAGLVGILGTPNKLAQYESAYEQSPTSFVHAEKVRVKTFEALYTYTIIGAGHVHIIRLCDSARHFCSAGSYRLFRLGYRYVSKERATAYEQAIDVEMMRLKQMTNNTP